MDPHQNHRPSILIVDPDLQFFDFLKKEHHSNCFNLKFASTGKDAQSQIASKAEPFYGIFINPEVTTPSGLSVVRCAFLHRPVTPIYMLLNKDTPLGLTPKDVKRLGVRDLIQKPLGLQEIVALVSPILDQFDAERILKNTPHHSDQINEEVQSEDNTLIPIRAVDFISGTKSFFDVYVKLASGRYLKLLQAGDSFTAERIETFLKKGVLHFFIRAEVQKNYLQYCDYLTSALLKHETAPIEIKTTQTLNQGEETLRFLRTQGVSESHLGYAQKFVQNVHTLVQQICPSHDNELDQFLKNAAAYEHGTSTSMLACLLALNLEIQMDKPVQIVGLASFFHDIGLYRLPENLWNEDESKMNKDQLSLYQTHPGLSLKILEKLKGIHPTVLQAVEQHHLRRGGKGFPASPHTLKLNKVSEIVGISDEFQKHLREAQTAGTLDVMLMQLERHVFPLFSRQIVYTFRSTFFPLKK